MPDADWVGEIGSGLAEAAVWGADHLGQIVLPLLGAGALWNWIASRDERLRDGYAEAIRTLVAWREFPYRVLRRAADEPATYALLTDRGHQVQEDFAYWTSWIASDNARVADAYRASARALREHLQGPIQQAWDSPPAASASSQARSTNLGIDHERCDAIVEAFQAVAHSRRAPHRWFRRCRTEIELIRLNAGKLANTTSGATGTATDGEPGSEKVR